MGANQELIESFNSYADGVEEMVTTVQVADSALLEGQSIADILGTVDTKISTAVADLIDSSSVTLDTLKELANAIDNDPNYSSTINTALATKETPSGAQSKVDLHANNTNNPHATTKSQVGLGNVQNLGLATALEAQVGSSNTTYMTPLRTNEAINSLGDIRFLGKTDKASDSFLLEGQTLAQVLSQANSGTSAAATKLATIRTIALNGDGVGSGLFDGSADLEITLTLANSGVTAGSYAKTTVNAKGLVTAGSNLLASDIPALDTGKLTSGTLAPARLSGSYAIDVSGNAATASKLFAARTISLSGAVSGSIAFDGSIDKDIVVALTDTGVIPGTYAKVSVDSDGRILTGAPLIAADIPTLNQSTTGNAATANKLATARSISVTGDVDGTTTFDGSANVSIAVTLDNSGVVAGTYGKVTVDAKGRVTTGVGISGLPVDGDASINGYSFTGDGDTGLFGIASGVSGIFADGVEVCRLNSTELLTSVPITRVTGSGKARWMQQDGTGRQHWYWNTVGGTTPTFETSGEGASDIMHHCEPTNGVDYFIYRAASGVGKLAGDPITWTDVLYASLQGAFKFKGNDVWHSGNLSNISQLTNDSGYLTSNQTISLSGDATGSGKTTIPLTLANSGVTAGTYGSATQTVPMTIDAKGRVTAVGVAVNITPAWANITGKPTTVAAAGLTDALMDSDKGVANGVASLDGTGKVPAIQLPSYVDDVLEFANLVSFPATGETGKIYIDLATNKTYRWGGSSYTIITASPGSTDAVPEGSANLYFTTARAQAAVTSVSGNAGTATKLATIRTISATGDATGSTTFDGSANATIALILSNSGVTAGTYPKVTVDSKGRVTAGAALLASDIPTLNQNTTGNAATATNVAYSGITGKPTTLSGYGITDAISSSQKDVVNGVAGLDVNGDLSPSVMPTSHNTTSRVSFLNGAAAQGINIGTLLVSNSYSDLSNVPVNGIYSKGDILSGGNVFGFSDVRLKKNVETIKDALNKVCSARGVVYDRTDIELRQMGVLAHEMMAVVPEVVSQTKDGILAVAYGNLAGLFIEAFKDLRQELESAKLEILELKCLINKE